MSKIQAITFPFEVLEVSQFKGSSIYIGPDIRFSVIKWCRQIIKAFLTGDMQFIYTLLGHSADFLHDMFRCIFCLHNFSTGEDGPLRSIRDFDSLAESYACNPVDQSLHLNIVKKPLLYVELTKVVSFFMRRYVSKEHFCFA